MVEVGGVVVTTALIVMANDCVAILLRLSVTRQVSDEALQDADGVPEITPPALSDNPAGNVPALIAHV